MNTHKIKTFNTTNHCKCNNMSRLVASNSFLYNMNDNRYISIVNARSVYFTVYAHTVQYRLEVKYINCLWNYSFYVLFMTFMFNNLKTFIYWVTKQYTKNKHFVVPHLPHTVQTDKYRYKSNTCRTTHSRYNVVYFY